MFTFKYLLLQSLRNTTFRVVFFIINKTTRRVVILKYVELAKKPIRFFTEKRRT